jgi:hypothetical protein
MTLRNILLAALTGTLLIGCTIYIDEGEDHHDDLPGIPPLQPDAGWPPPGNADGGSGDASPPWSPDADLPGDDGGPPWSPDAGHPLPNPDASGC